MTDLPPLPKLIWQLDGAYPDAALVEAVQAYARAAVAAEREACAALCEQTAAPVGELMMSDFQWAANACAAAIRARATMETHA